MLVVLGSVVFGVILFTFLLVIDPFHEERDNSHEEYREEARRRGLVLHMGCYEQGNEVYVHPIYADISTNAARSGHWRGLDSVYARPAHEAFLDLSKL
jgi:hypothetical protein